MLFALIEQAAKSAALPAPAGGISDQQVSTIQTTIIGAVVTLLIPAIVAMCYAIAGYIKSATAAVDAKTAALNAATAKDLAAANEVRHVATDQKVNTLVSDLKVNTDATLQSAADMTLVKADIHRVEKATNSLTDRLVESTRLAAQAEGEAKGRAEQKAEGSRPVPPPAEPLH
jgi:hypothetical protein